MLLRDRPWHETEPSRPAWLRALMGLGAAIAGIGLPIAVLVGLQTASTPKPPEQPAAPSLGRSHVAVAVDDAGIDGTWTLAADGQSWVGYRIAEELPRLRGTFEAVGRTRAVEGELVASGITVERVDVRADLRKLASDRDWRDRVIRRRYLQSNAHPEARFRLLEPFALLGLPDVGERVTVRVRGELTIREVTRRVSVDLQGRWDGDHIRVVGSFPVLLADHGVSPPRIAGFRLVDDQAMVELSLRFVRGDTVPTGG